jgi:hypothetical protein
MGMWVSGARQYTKNSYRDLTPDLKITVKVYAL